MIVATISSGVPDDGSGIADYRFEQLGDVFVERVVWRDGAPVGIVGGRPVRGGGNVWYRFWLPGYALVVERYFTRGGEPLGTLVNLCASMLCDQTGCSALDLLLDLWIDTTGQVTLYNEERFDASLAGGALTAEEAQHAERRVRELTAAVAKGKFPPPLVRNWRVDPARLTQGGF